MIKKIVGLLLLILPIFLTLFMWHKNLIFKWSYENEYTILTFILYLAPFVFGLFFLLNKGKRFYLGFIIIVLSSFLYILIIFYTQPNNSRSFNSCENLKLTFDKSDGGAFSSVNYIIVKKLAVQHSIFYKETIIAGFENVREAKFALIKDQKIGIIIETYEDKTLTKTLPVKCVMSKLKKNYNPNENQI